MSAEILVTVDSLAALSLKERQSWLEASWEALRPGELVLEEMP